MDSNPFVTINIHGAPMMAATDPNTSSLILSAAAPYYNGSHVTFFCDDKSLARDLADAINAVLLKHRATRRVLLEAAE